MGENDHILILTPGFPKDEEDSTCIPPLQTYLKAFQQQFPETKISVIAFQYPYSDEPYQWNGIEVRPCNGKLKKGLHKAWTWRRAMTLFRSIHHEQAVTQVHSLWFGECAMIGERIKKKFDIPHVVTVQGQDAKSDNKWLRRMNLDEMKVVCLSEQQAAVFKNSTGHQPVVIPWGQAGNSNALPEKSIDIIGVGSLIPVKRYDMFIRIIAEIMKQKPDLKCVLIGEGEEEQMLKDSAAELGVADNIEFTGQIEHDQVLAYMQGSKVFLHTSQYEGQGIVFEEALAAGCRICSFQVGGAERSDRWSIASSENALLSETTKFLEQEPLKEGLIRHPISKTIEAYERIYG